MAINDPINICVFAPEIHDPVSHDLLKGINSKLDEYNAQIDVVSAGGLYDITGAENSNVYLYKTILKTKKFDGLIIFAGSLANFTSVKETKDFLKFIPNDLPTISLSLEIPGYDLLEVDNFEPIREMVNHLIKTHNKKRIAFIKGPNDHLEAENRYLGFIQGLKDNNNAPIDELIFEGNYSPYSGSQAIQNIIKNKIELPDAIVCADDDTALGVYAELKKHKIDIKKNSIAITGFDNMDFSRSIEPQLTTVDQSLYLQGQKSLEIIISKIKNREIKSLHFKPHNIYRESCGCIKNKKSDNGFNLEKIYNSQIPDLDYHKSDLQSIFEEYTLSNNLDIKEKIDWYIDLYVNKDYNLVTLSEILTNLTLNIASLLDPHKLSELTIINQELNYKIILLIDNIKNKESRHYHDTSSELARVIVQIAKSLEYRELLAALNRDYYFIGIKSIFLKFPGSNNKDLKLLSENTYVKDKHINIKKSDYYTLYHPVSSKNERGFAKMEVDTKGFEIAEVITYQITRALYIIELFNELDLKIDELQNSYDSLRETKDLLIESEQLAKIGGFVSYFTHELNNPIGISVTAITHLQETVKDLKNKYRNNQLTKTELTKHIENTENVITIINNNLNRATKLIRGFKQIAVDQGSELKRDFYLKSYVDEIIHSLTPMLKKTKHEIIVDINDRIKINSYPGLFSQIITNLIQNSLIHGFEGIKQGTIDISSFKENDNLVIIYKDDGIGCSDETLNNMFDSYYSTKIGKGGSGIGMALIKKLITEKLDGNIMCSSEPGKGIMFKITLPDEIVI